MVDLVALANLFIDVFGAAKGWTEPKVARFVPLSDAEREPVFIKLKTDGHKLSGRERRG